jgi:hypothetical protein
MLNNSQPDRPPRAVNGIVLVYIYIINSSTNINGNCVKYWVYYSEKRELDRLCGLVVRVPGYRSRGQGSIPGATRFSDK